MADLEALAVKLTEAQLQAIDLWDDASHASPDRVTWLLDNITDAEIKEIRELGLATKATVRPPRGSHLTPLGLELRLALRAKANQETK